MEGSLDWWGFGIIAISVFTGCLLLNYIVKKMNEATLDERLVKLHQKSPAGQVTQVPQVQPLGKEGGRYSLSNEARKPAALNIEKNYKGRQEYPTASFVENVEAKPIFLGTIYSKVIDVKPTNRDTEANEDILNDVLDRAMADIHNFSPQTPASNDEILEDKNNDGKSGVTIINANVQIAKIM